MADYIEVNIPSLKTDVGDMADELKQIRARMKQMFDEMEALDAMWDGPANRAFHIQFQSDYRLMEDMCRIADKIIAYGDNARQEYTSCENAVAAVIADIKI